MDSMINIGSKQSKKNLNKLNIFISKVFKAGKQNGREKEEVIAALELAVKAFSTNGVTVNGCILKNGKK